MGTHIPILEMAAWPVDVRHFVEGNLESFRGWECSCCERGCSASDYDTLTREFRDLLRGYSLLGYHCTRLTKDEIDAVCGHGMSLQDGHSLTLRINKLQTTGAITACVASLLKQRHQADETYRANMLWFCFNEPHLAGESGIERLLRSWGGEALYNSHEDDSITGPFLCGVGTPCVVEALVPISSLSKHMYPDSVLFRVALSDAGHRSRNPLPYQGYAKESLPAAAIRNVAQYPGERFMELTQCNSWRTQLT